MSETEDDSDYDEEDLDAPPRKTDVPVKASVVALKVADAIDDEETQDEEDVQELSASQFRREVQHKHEMPLRGRNVDYAAIVRRSSNNGSQSLRGLCLLSGRWRENCLVRG